MRKLTMRTILRFTVVTGSVAAILASIYVVGNDLFLEKNESFGDALVVTQGRMNLWWDPVPESIKRSSLDTGTHNNIDLSSYVGHESCEECHQKNYDGWSKHSHRWMNALADESTVKGDFSGETEIAYLRGRAEFYREGNDYRMQLVRGERRRVYTVTQTIGSRFFQYYVGKQVDGPEPDGHKFYREDHVLPFGYWLEEREWANPAMLMAVRFKISRRV